MPRQKFPLELDYVHVTRYQGGVTGGVLEWESCPTTPLQGRVVIIIDDVLEEGDTMDALMDYCKKQGAETCYSAVLVNKNLSKQKSISADFIGLEVDSQYLYGLGVDYKGLLT